MSHKQPKPRKASSNSVKDTLLNQGNYTPIPNKVITSIGITAAKHGFDGGKALAFYVYLMRYVDSQEFVNGKKNPRYGWAYPTVEMICTALKMSHNKVNPTAKFLESVGLLETKTERQQGKTFKLYKPLLPSTGMLDTVGDDLVDVQDEDVQDASDVQDVQDLLSEYVQKGWL